MTTPLAIDARVVIPANELSWRAVRASGPGGQNVNKVSSKVELRFDLANTRALDPGAAARLRVIAAGRIDADGRVVIVSQKTRDQTRNLEDARERLRELVLRALERPRVRRPTRPGRGAIERRLDEKRRQGVKKRERSGE